MYRYNKGIVIIHFNDMLNGMLLFIMTFYCSGYVFNSVVLDSLCLAVLLVQCIYLYNVSVHNLQARRGVIVRPINSDFGLPGVHCIGGRQLSLTIDFQKYPYMVSYTKRCLKLI